MTVFAIVALVLFVMDMILCYKIYRERKQWRQNTAPLPSFTKESCCVKCGLPVNDQALDINMEVKVGNRLLPVVAKICERCVAVA